MGKDGLQVAIDGPASAGKSTVAKIVAHKFNYIYVDTGAMYRALTLAALDQRLELTNEDQLIELLRQITISFQPASAGQRVFINETEVTDEIRSEIVTNNVSTVAALPAIRRALVARQQELALAGGIVMDGRDIGTTVLPRADLKIFLVASVAQRAKWRYLENQQKGITTSLKTLQAEIAERDYKDSHRATSPLRKAPDAIEIDTTSLTIEQVCEQITRLMIQKANEFRK
ncbi:Cytidylate kinase [Fructilactobacillus florum 8D]|uniref:Cytidylate kinase n=1 Tax=Fructilactobacillus florum 8D TaxID=1221538 RepID=W9EIM0_9LACO|nr:(d)CMP kinase [Fructilactobacillus florum]EKK20170.1 Cytidylate kinase [Fructilactobacillus florum 2F]ETO40855.1 Cytidylate kinase [Fructilactobacillus florum 8D]